MVASDCSKEILNFYPSCRRINGVAVLCQNVKKCEHAPVVD